MRAAVCREFGAPLTIEEVDLDPPGAGEVRVRVGACAVCHSDVTFLRGGWGGRLPMIVGHEAAGTVIETGPGVADVDYGDRVVVTLVRSCGRCRHCHRGEEVACEGTWPRDHESPIVAADGERVIQGMRTGAFAEEVVVDRSQVVVIDDDLPFDQASLLACGVITGMGAVRNTADVRPGDTIVVIGAGGVGLNAVQGAALSAAEQVVAVDVSDTKLAMAVALGATHVVNSSTTDLRDAVMGLTGGAGADHVLVAVGSPEVYRSATDLLARFGTLVIVGMPATGVLATIEPTVLADRSQRILGSKMGGARISVDIPDLVELHRAGRLQLEPLISGRFPLDQINEAIATATGGDVLRNVIVFEEQEQQRCG